LPAWPVLSASAREWRAGRFARAFFLVGEDPRQLVKLNRTMDAALKGHPYVKSGIDIAVLGPLGQSIGLLGM
jgi:hypothetical protein